MALWNTTNTYGSVAKFFHWLIFFMLLFMVTLGYCLDYFSDAYQGVAYNVHKLTGLSILILMVLRGLWALCNPKPVLPFNTPAWEGFLARSVHYLLYFVVIAMPLLGLIGSSSAGKPPHLDSISLGLPIEKNEALIDFCFTWHNRLAIALIVLFSLHVLAALYHHYIRRDAVLRRMLP